MCIDAPGGALEARRGAARAGGLAALLASPVIAFQTRYATLAG